MGLPHYSYATSGHDIDMNDSAILRWPSLLLALTYSFHRQGFSLVGKDRSNITWRKLLHLNLMQSPPQSSVH